MNRKRTPAQPFNYGKVGKGKETEQMGSRPGGKEAVLEFFAGLQRAMAFQIKSFLHIL